jgi:hypothetical protein
MLLIKGDYYRMDSFREAKCRILKCRSIILSNLHIVPNRTRVISQTFGYYMSGGANKGPSTFYNIYILSHGFVYIHIVAMRHGPCGILFCVSSGAPLFRMLPVALAPHLGRQLPRSLFRQAKKTNLGWMIQ